MVQEPSRHQPQRRSMRSLIRGALAAVATAGFALAYAPTGYPLGATAVQPPMGGMPMAGPMVPPVKGYTEGKEILFAHTEASDPQVAQMLTRMMGSLVLVVPSLAQLPEDKLANVYVFTNGIQGGGPMGFQPDVFDKPAGTAGYTPLRSLNLVTWKNEQGARVLRSVAEINAAAASDEVTIKRPGVVVNMPMLTWPGGDRTMPAMNSGMGMRP